MKTIDMCVFRSGYIRVVRQSFDERYHKYLEDYEQSKKYMEERLKHMSKEELAYLLAEHDKFIMRDACAEYASDDIPSGVSYYASSDCDDVYINQENHVQPVDKLDPLGRKVSIYGRLI